MALADGSVQFAKVGTRDSIAYETESELGVAIGTYTQSGGNETGTINMMQLPAGAVRVHSNLSRVDLSQFGAGALVDIGYAEHVNEAGTTVVADPNAFAADLAAGAGVIGESWPLPAVAGQYTELDSQEGIVITLTVKTGNIEDGDTIALVCSYGRIS